CRLLLCCSPHERIGMRAAQEVDGGCNAIDIVSDIVEVQHRIVKGSVIVVDRVETLQFCPRITDDGIRCLTDMVGCYRLEIYWLIKLVEQRISSYNQVRSWRFLMC